ncbi:MAG: PIN domain-containing protein [Candidatus Hodarchaeales archaeon]|jgi:predicted nucleic acid-binding protein
MTEVLKKIILDTTYVLPLFGIEVSLGEKFKNQLSLLWRKKSSDFNVYLPSVSLIEVMYKLNREFRKQNDINILKRYPQILPTVTTSHISIDHPLLNPLASEIANKIRHAGHRDLMDCWIAASAIHLNGILITEDKELVETIKKIVEFKTTPIWNWNKFKINQSDYFEII